MQNDVAAMRDLPRPFTRCSISGLLLAIVLIAPSALASGCRESRADGPPAIEFDVTPRAGEGGADTLDTISGHVTGVVQPGQRIVLFAQAGVWWVQPFEARPYTSIQSDLRWKSQTHLGSHYAALLVDQSYQPPATVAALPKAGGPIIAVAVTEGSGSQPAQRTPKTVEFSGYTWEVRQAPSNRGGNNEYEAENVSVDAQGLLHLKIARRGDQWTCAEVKLTRSLGYGTYSFVARDITNLDPAATFSMFTWDDLGADQNHRGIDVEIGRWGVVANKNAQYLIQPYYVPANVFRFAAPAGRLTHAFRWQPGLVSFSTLRAPATPGGRAAAPLSTHDFVAGVPAAGGETVRINLYVFRDAPVPIARETEVVLEKFEYLP
jgi:hypothetical protein